MPTREELADRFFPEVTHAKSADDVRDAVEMNTRGCEVILLDFIKRHDEGFDAYGTGALVVNIANDFVGYVTTEGFSKDAEEARKHGDTPIAEFLEAVTAQAEANSTRNLVLILLIDKSGQRLLPLSRDMPAEQIREMQYAMAAGMKGKSRNRHGLIIPGPAKGFGKGG